jgi:hypothetical protein
MCSGAPKLLNRVRIDSGEPAILVRKVSPRWSRQKLPNSCVSRWSHGVSPGTNERKVGVLSIAYAPVICCCVRPWNYLGEKRLPELHPTTVQIMRPTDALSISSDTAPVKRPERVRTRMAGSPKTRFCKLFSQGFLMFLGTEVDSNSVGFCSRSIASEKEPQAKS